jgi:hypothetical protein
MLLTLDGSSDGPNGESNGWMRWTPLLALTRWTAAEWAAIVAMRSTSIQVKGTLFLPQEAL